MQEKIKGIIPGLIVCLIVTVISKILGAFIPSLGAATFAILLGIILGNTIITHKRYAKGIKFSEKILLDCAVALLGVSVNLKEIMSIGYKGVLFIILQMALTITITYIIGMKLKFGKKYSLLMCAGNAVCGSSAIGATAPVIEADQKDKALAVTMVNLTGTILMFILPVITMGIYHNETVKSSALLGGTLQSVGQVIASGNLINANVTEMATIFKIIRIIGLVVVVMILAKINSGHNKEELIKEEKKAIKKAKVSAPWFIYAFFALTILYSIGFIPHVISSGLHTIGQNFEIIALVAIGMNVKFKDLKNQGVKAITYSGLVGLSQIICAIVLIRILL